MNGLPQHDRGLPVPNLLWHCDRPLGAHELAAGGLARRFDALQGQFALHVREGDEHLLARDRLGVNKLFVAVANGELRASNYAIDLVRAGQPLSTIRSVPSGHLLRTDPDHRTWQLRRGPKLAFGEPAELDAAGFAALARSIRSRLEATFAQLAGLLRGHRVVVTLSGGLDSTTIAALARRWFHDVTAVTFDLQRPDGAPSEDAACAARAARELGLRFEVVTCTPQQILEQVDAALVCGQDWREFNVHCALVNLALARGIAASAPDAMPIVVLTGDVMNELVADYEPVPYGGRELYALPRLPAGRLRRFLVAGLDAGDREIGVFAHHGITAVQPYAWCADAYAAVPANLLGVEEFKRSLVRAVMGDDVPGFVLGRHKVRAQAGGSEPGGVLGVLVDEGIDAAWLANRFGELYGAAPRDLQDFVRAGLYRFSTPFAA